MSEVQLYAVLHRFTDLSLLEGWDGLGMEMVAAADYDALKAENARLSEVAAAEMKLREGNFDTITQLEAENARLREALGDAREALFIIGCHPIKHDPQAYVVIRGIAETAIDKLDAALSPQESTK